jgi:hypothetical protein
MHVEPAHAQNLVPRLAQHPVRRRTIQSVVHPAADERTYYTANSSTDGGGYGYHRA